jgi:hypothetical protein
MSVQEKNKRKRPAQKTSHKEHREHKKKKKTHEIITPTKNKIEKGGVDMVEDLHIYSTSQHVKTTCQQWGQGGRYRGLLGSGGYRGDEQALLFFFYPS